MNNPTTLTQASTTCAKNCRPVEGLDRIQHITSSAPMMQLVDFARLYSNK